MLIIVLIPLRHEICYSHRTCQSLSFPNTSPKLMLNESLSDSEATVSWSYGHLHLPPGSLLLSDWREIQRQNLIPGLFLVPTVLAWVLQSLEPEGNICCYFISECKPRSEKKGERGRDVGWANIRHITEQTITWFPRNSLFDLAGS